MSFLSGRSLAAHPRSRWFLVALSFILAGCERPVKSNTTTAPPPAVANDLAKQLAQARVEQATNKLAQKQPAEALALLVSALKSDPASDEAQSLAAKILGETVWNFPVLTIQHELPIDQIHAAGSSTLWVSLGGEVATTVRWNLETLAIENVLLPVSGHATRSLVFGPASQSVVIERGPVNLLCDARTLKPIRDLGPLPDFLTPAAVVVFSPDGLLLAHPGYVSETDQSIVWQIRDTATGQTIRKSEPSRANSPRPLAATLNRDRLRVIHADGSLIEMPVSPVEAVQTIPMPEPAKLLNAQFSADGNAVLTRHEQGPHQAPIPSIISYHDQDDGSLEPDKLVSRFPWSRHPNIWNGLMSDPEFAPFAIDGSNLKFLSGSHAPIELTDAITAVAFDGSSIITGEQSGVITSHRRLPHPTKATAPVLPCTLDQNALSAFEKLCDALSGVRRDEKDGSFHRLSPADRLLAVESCDFVEILEIFPTLNFEPIKNIFAELQQREARSTALLPMWDRLARADLSGKSWPAILKQASALAATPWYRQLTAAVAGEESADSPWFAASRMKKLFHQADTPTVLTSIREAGGNGPAAASALALALASDQAEWITTCLETAIDLPPTLRQIALSRVAWLEGKKAKALSPWPEVISEMTEIRQREDWDGWEQADFAPALETIRQSVNDELLAIQVPEPSTPEQRKAVAERLADPETAATVGKPRYALACMNAALAFSSHKEESAITFELANTARNLGAPPAPCLRAEALALTAMGEYQKAHPLWIELITEHPLETQIPGDYAEAAYTAFENSDPQQAMTILTTGLHRYPQDANYALRAGWVAILTGNADRGYQFLQVGNRIGFPQDKLENATALLTIAAAQSGADDDATVHFNDLLRIDPAWAELKTLDSLEWPEELKTALSQFMH